MEAMHSSEMEIKLLIFCGVTVGR